MTLERWLRSAVGALVLLSVVLAFLFEDEGWLIVTGILGFSLFQSGFTNWCPMMTVLRLMGAGKDKG